MSHLEIRVALALAATTALAAAPAPDRGPLAAPYDLTVEALTDPVGLDTPRPRLSWKLASSDPTARNLRPVAYQILVASTLEELAADRGDLWDSGRVESDRTLWVPYDGRPLRTGQRCYWKVRAWEASRPETPSPWSEPGRWVMGVVDPADWRAHWIGPHPSTRPPFDLGGAKWIWAGQAASLTEAAPGRTVYMRTFDLSPSALTGQVVLAITADDTYRVFINGRLATRTWGHFNAWRWMRFVAIETFLRPGTNTIVIEVDNLSPSPTGLLAAMALADGTRIPTDEQWLATTNVARRTRDDELPQFDSATLRPAVLAADVDGPPWGRIEREVELLPPSFAHRFQVRPGLRQATLFISGLGFYEALLDGQRIGDRRLDPPFTRYDRRVLYSTYDLTTSLPAGMHELRVDLAHGWYDVRTVCVWNFDNAPWRGAPRLLAQLELVYADGSTEYVVTDERWRHVRPTLAYDCIREGVVVAPPRADAPDPDRTELHAVRVPPPGGRLVAAALPPTVITEEIAPSAIRSVADRTWVVEFPQNLAGWVRLRLRNQSPGDLVRLRYGERLTADGRLDPHPIDVFFKHSGSLFVLPRGSFQTDRIVCSGAPEQVFEPRFAYHGFQYVEIEGLRQAPTPDDVRACVLHTDFRTAGEFECNVELLNRIQKLTRWSYRGNFVQGYPTDCPHREKNGWTGDAHLAAEQAMYNFDNHAAYVKWVRDLIDEQQPEGRLPGIVPTSGWGYQWGNGPAWDSALALIPWLLYVYRGDRDILAEAYPAIARYVEYLERCAQDGIVSIGLGDWLPAKVKTPVEVTSTGYFYVDARIAAAAARLLGRAEEAARFERLADSIAAAFHRKFHTGDGRYSVAGQTAQSCALHQGLAPEAIRPLAFQRLVEAVERADRHVDCGILGAKYLFRTLSEFGRTDLALAVALQETPPSYGAWIRRGATTLWEDWGEGASRNHIMFGDISAWMYQYLAGIRLAPNVSTVGGPTDPAVVAFKEFVIAPEPVPPLQWVKAWHASPFGRIAVHWETFGGHFRLHVEVPVGTRATVVFPTRAELPSGLPGQAVSWSDGRRALQVGSGRYIFEVPMQ